MRICSLLPSATEIVAELGPRRLARRHLGGVRLAPEVRGLPVVTCGVRKCVLAANRADSNSGRVCAPNRLELDRQPQVDLAHHQIVAPPRATTEAAHAAAAIRSEARPTIGIRLRRARRSAR
jgi:hypothetical protein